MLSRAAEKKAFQLKTVKVLWNSAFISGSLNCKEMWIIFFFPLGISAVLMYNRGVWL